MTTDPRITAASMESLPTMLRAFEDMESKVEQATADLPAERSFAELTPQEKAQIASLIGYDEATLEELSSSTIWEDDSAAAIDVEEEEAAL